MADESVKTFCFNGPEKLLNISNIILKTLDPPLNNYPSKGLSKEIWNKFNDHKQTTAAFKNKMNLWKELNNFIKVYFPNYGFYTAGSTINGFGLQSSDIDFSFLSPTSKSRKKEESTAQLMKLFECLQKFDKIKKLELIKANVPLVCFDYSQYNLEVDINYNATANIRNSHLLLNYSLVDWRIRPLVAVIKLWAIHNNLIHAKYCSFSSYPLILLVIHFLQAGTKPAVLPNLQALYKLKFEDTCSIQSINFAAPIDTCFTQKPSENKQSLEDLLIDFFNYYRNFEFENYVISIRKGDKIPLSEYLLEKLRLRTEHRFILDASSFMFIEEPFNLSNVGNTIRKRTTFEKMKNCFHCSYEKLNEKRKLSAIL